MRVFRGAILISMLGCRLSAAAPNPCDPSLIDKVEKSNPYRYALRGDRCEGIYVPDVAATGNLLVASFLRLSTVQHPSSTSPLTLLWDRPPNAAEIHVRALPLRLRLHYRMDTIQPAAASQYVWPGDVFSLYGLNSQNFGVIAWTTLALSGEERTVLLPLSVGAQPFDKSGPKRYELVLIPPIDVKRLYIKIAHLGADGKADTSIKDPPLPPGPYAADRPIRITLASLSKDGFYAANLGADFTPGGTTSATIFFNVPK